MNPAPFELQIQRLVDGELDPEQRAELLRKLDADAQAWRDVALAFVEDQSYRSQYRAVGAGQWPTSPVARRESYPGKFNVRILAMAAAVLIALLVGFGLGDRLTRIPAPTGESVATSGGPSRTSQAATIAEPGVLNNASFKAGVPGDRWLPEIPATVKEQFLRGGYQIVPEFDLRTGRLSDGREIVFPVQRFNISTHGQ